MYWIEESGFGGYTVLAADGRGRIDPRERDAIVDDIDAGIPTYGIRAYFDNIPGIFDRYDAAVVARDTGSGRFAAILAGRWDAIGDHPFFYLWTAFVGTRHTRQGLQTRMLYSLLQMAARHGRGVPTCYVAKTTNAVVYVVMRRLLAGPVGGRMYPDVTRAEQGGELRGLAAELMQRRWPELRFDAGSGLVAEGIASISPRVQPDVPHSGDPSVDAYFQRHLTRRDQMLCIVQNPPGSGPALLDRFVRRFGSIRGAPARPEAPPAVFPPR